MERLAELGRRLEPLQRPLAPPGPSDWLAHHAEPGQTFREYVAQGPVFARGTRRVLYVLPIGAFDAPRERVLERTVAFLAAYFGLEVRRLDPVPVGEDWPAHARRTHPTWGDDQLLSTHVLDAVLRPRLPADAAALLGLTCLDLWPGRGWNFVFGQASLDGRVGVWSLHRNGDPTAGEEAYRTFLRRTLKTATHEAAHAFGLRHCTAWECNLCGSNTREESDRHPLWACSECLPKLCLATGVDPLERARALERFCRAEGLEEEAAYWARARARLSE